MKKILVGVAVLVLTAGCGVPASTTASPVNASGRTTELAALLVAPEDTGAHYRRTDWPHWSQVGGGCDARENALKTQGRHVTTGAGCKITGGEWTSPYDGVTTTNPGVLDIDHLVPLAEVARSGTRTWTREQRERYANDADVLIAVTLRSNRQKGDQDPAHWLPALDRCGYVTHWIEVKRRYGMTVDQAEHNAIADVLNHCPGNN